MPSRNQRLPPLGVTELGAAVRTAFRVPDAPVLVTRDLTYGPLSVLELRCDADDYGKSEPLPEHDAVMVSLQLRTSVDHQIWEDGKRLPKTRVVAGSTSIFDLRREVVASSMRPFHCLNFVFPLRALDQATDEVFCRFELGRAALQGLHDPVIQALGSALLPAIERPATAPRLFVDHVLFALRAHVAARFGAPADRFAESGERWSSSKRASRTTWRSLTSPASAGSRSPSSLAPSSARRGCLHIGTSPSDESNARACCCYVPIFRSRTLRFAAGLPIRATSRNFSDVRSASAPEASAVCRARNAAENFGFARGAGLG
jgi:hypothetical protein